MYGFFSSASAIKAAIRMTGVLCPPLQSRVTRQVFGDEPRRASPLFVDGHHGTGQHVQHREGEGHEQGEHAGQHQPVPRQHIDEADHDLRGGKYDAAQNDGQLLTSLLGEFVYQRVHQQRPGDGDGQDQHGVRLRKTHQRGHIVHDARLKERHARALERADDQRADIAEGAAGHKEERADGVGVHPHRPSLCRLLSEPAAISGSVTASMMCPTALIMPMMVSTPSTSRPCGMRSGMPDALEGW